MPVAVVNLDWRIHRQVKDWPRSKDCVFIAATILRLGHLSFPDWLEREADWANHQPPPYLPAPEIAFDGDKRVQQRHDEFASVIKRYLSPAAFEVIQLDQKIKAQVQAGQYPDPDLQDQIRAADVRAYLQEDRDDPVTRAHWEYVWWQFLEVSSQLDGATKRLPHVAGDLVARAQDARLKTFARPKRGGKTIPLAPYHWEVDPDIGLQRIASCSINPEAYLDLEAAQTHWIFVDKADLDREMQAYDEEQDLLLKEAEKPLNRLVGDTENECAAWLTGQFEDPHCPLLIRDQFFEGAKKALGSRLSERAFLKVWAAVTIDYPERSDPGPRLKKANSPR